MKQITLAVCLMGAFFLAADTAQAHRRVRVGYSYVPNSRYAPVYQYGPAYTYRQSNVWHPRSSVYLGRNNSRYNNFNTRNNAYNSRNYRPTYRYPSYSRGYLPRVRLSIGF